MEILFTGASSFTGYWFVKALAEAGHAVTAIFKRPLHDYTGVRGQRVQMALPLCTPHFGIRFGTEPFLSLIRSKPKWDLFCHHAADVTDYKSDAFDPVKALQSNALNLPQVLHGLKDQGCDKVLLTGSVFEQREGMGTAPLVAFSPYGLSKGLTADLFEYYTRIQEMVLGKFVIPNPFGPYEEERFTSYMMGKWLEGQPVRVRTPLYIRDNVPVTLLAKGYAQFASDLCQSRGFPVFRPSCYAESQGHFTARCANEMRTRINRPCVVIVEDQTSFKEPMKRVNVDWLDWNQLSWNETAAWDAFAEYYTTRQAIQV